MKTLNTNWLKKPTAITGQDPLGSRYPSELTYTELLPNITNVTDRARYYSFYTWLIWAIEKHSGKLKQESLYKIIRKADSLFTLIAMYHHHITPDTEDLLHTALVGSNKLTEVIGGHAPDEKPIRISKYAERDNNEHNRYFKNKYGGLGQYYMGPLKSEKLLATPESGEIRYTEEKGKLIAENFDAGVDRKLFFEILERDSVTIVDLKKLLSFCPCRISENTLEQFVLTDFFFNQTDEFYLEQADNRRLTLTLLLDLIERTQNLEDAVTLDGSGVVLFLESVYSNTLPNKSLWNLENEKLTAIKENWRQYYSNELLSYPIETFFWAGLERLFLSNAVLPNAKSYGKWFAAEFRDAIRFDYESGLQETLEEVSNSLPDLDDIHNPEHEINLVRKIQGTVRGGNAEVRQDEAVADSVNLLLTIIARWTKENFKETFVINLRAGYRWSYPINLQNLFYHIENTWSDLSIKDWIEWLTANWNIETHLKIALRKIRYETSDRIKLIDSFKILPNERGLEVIESVEPAFTSPRLKQALQILFDLGLIDKEDDRRLFLTDLGRETLEKNRQ